MFGHDKTTKVVFAMVPSLSEWWFVFTSTTFNDVTSIFNLPLPTQIESDNSLPFSSVDKIEVLFFLLDEVIAMGVELL